MTPALPIPPDGEAFDDSAVNSQTKKSIKPKLKILIPLAVLLVAAGFGLRYWLTRPDDSVIALSGRIESYESDLGAKVGGKVKLVAVREGDRVALDSAPETALAAKVTAIDTAASFTPENIYFQDDRVTQVFGLKLAVENPDGFAKPGMPADGQILLEDEGAVE